jgi:hypothetical protein
MSETDYLISCIRKILILLLTDKNLKSVDFTN